MCSLVLAFDLRALPEPTEGFAPGAPKEKRMKTIREYYLQLDFKQHGNPEDVFDNLEIIGYGFFQERLSKKLVEWPYWNDLFLEVIKVATERGDMPFKGGPTAA